MFSLGRLRLGSCARGNVKSGVFEKLCDEKRSGGLGKSSKEVSESAVNEDEESRERCGSCSKYGSGVSAVQEGRLASAWNCAAEAADTPGEAAARCVGAARPLYEQAEMALAGSVVAVMVEVKVGRERVGDS